MPQIRSIGVVGVLGQNDPPTDGMRGMIEGLLGRRTGVSRGRRLHYVGRKCPLLRIGAAFQPEAVGSSSQWRPGCWSHHS